MRRHAWNERGSAQCSHRHGPTDVAGIGGSRACAFARSFDLLLAADLPGAVGKRLADGLRERLLFLGVGHAAYKTHVLVHQRGQGVVGQRVVGAVDKLHLHTGLAGQRTSLRALEDALPNAVERGHAGVPGVEEQLGIVGDDVGRRPTVGDDVVDARGIGHMLPQELDGVAHDHQSVQRGAAGIGRGGRMRGLAVEAELRGNDR